VAERVLLDTCALLWLVNGDPLAAEAKEIIRGSRDSGTLFLSPISAWEIAAATRKRRMTLNRDVEDWFDEAVSGLDANLSELTSTILIRSVWLPGDPPADPADRILIATCRRNVMRLMTRDRKILSYAEQGFVAAIVC
jgi:PIN domain nuclease of toxin-antitoxin system